MAMRICSWMDGMSQRARKAMRICSRMNGSSQGAMDGGVRMYFNLFLREHYASYTSKRKRTV